MIAARPASAGGGRDPITPLRMFAERAVLVEIFVPGKKPVSMLGCVMKPGVVVTAFIDPKASISIEGSAARVMKRDESLGLSLINTQAATDPAFQEVEIGTSEQVPLVAAVVQNGTQRSEVIGVARKAKPARSTLTGTINFPPGTAVFSLYGGKLVAIVVSTDKTGTSEVADEDDLNSFLQEPQKK